VNTAISFQDINSIPTLVKDYLSQKNELQNLYDLPFSFESFQIKTLEKQENYKHREVLYKQIKKQNSTLNLSEIQKQNIELLKSEKTFTITTGHQLNLFTGPIFFIYKILQTIKTCNELNKKQHNFNYVPIFWMASEDHDFEEINHFKYRNKTYTWETKQNGAVGNFILDDSFKELLHNFIIENGEFSSIEFFKNLKSQISNLKSLSDFTRYFVNELFKEYGLLIIDGNDSELKKTQIDFYKNELLEQKSYHKISETNILLKGLGYKIQVNPRDINLFYLDNNGRNRIEFVNSHYKLLNTDKQFTKEEVLLELEKYPEKFSPNALLRPFYQESILPNVAYIGGNAEICYWLQLKSLFDCENVSFPILIPRSSFFIINEYQKKKMNKLHWEIDDLLVKKEDLILKNIKQYLQVNIDFCESKRKIQAIYSEMKNEAKKTDISLLNLLNAQEYRQLKAFDLLQKRLLKAEKKKNKEVIDRIEVLYSDIFPNNNWQERELNFLEFYTKKTPTFFETIYNSILPFESKCFCINYKD